MCYGEMAELRLCRSSLATHGCFLGGKPWDLLKKEENFSFRGPCISVAVQVEAAAP